MWQKLFLFFSIILLVTSCGKKSTDENSSSTFPETLPSSFPSLSLQGNIVIMHKPEAGAVTVPLENYKKFYESDADGNPMYITSQIVTSFKRGTDIRMTENTGLALRFKVPEIKKDDYLIIDSEIQLPKEIEIAGVKRDRLIGSFKYDYRNSNKYEYIMIIFNQMNPFLFVEGEWQITLSNHDEQLLIQKFNVRR